MDIQEKKRPDRAVWPYMFAGVAIGAALGVLLAPDKGQDTRGKLTSWLREKREQGRRFANSRRHGARVDDKTPVEV